jgi:hypothetical protein
MKSSQAVLRPANFDAVHLSTPLDALPTFPYVTRSQTNAHEIFANRFVQELDKQGFFAELDKAQQRFPTDA